MKKPTKTINRIYRGLHIPAEASFRLDELQLMLKKKGCKPQEVSFSKIVAALILSTEAGDLLEEKFLST